MFWDRIVKEKTEKAEKTDQPFMMANYHTHTWRCMHAWGTEQEFVEKAIELGIRRLGFSDHVPCPFQDGYVSRIRMTMDQAEDYVKVIRDLQFRYRDDIDIKVGFEAEYIPCFFETQRKQWIDLGIDYVIMGQHFYDAENRSPYMGRRFSDESILERYVDSIEEGMQTGLFTYLCHPDLPDFTGDAEAYDRQMRRLCTFMKEQNIPVEANLLGWYEKRHYPAERFWKIAGETGCRTVFGLDAHSTEHLANRRGRETVGGMLERCGISPENDVELKPIR